MLFENEFNKMCLTCNLTRIYIKLFYDKQTCQSIADFDGCFILNNSINIPKKNLTTQIKKTKATMTLKNNNKQTLVE